MLAYRVFAYDPAAEAKAPGHPDYLHIPAQGLLRLDNPHHYLTWYYGATPEAAIAESFANQDKWSNDMFQIPFLPSGRRTLGLFEIDDARALRDMDDARTLINLSLRPTQVISRTRATTQEWALRVFQERRQHDGERKWDGVRWWSFHRPQWTVYGLWVEHADEAPHELVATESLTKNHPAVLSARKTLNKDWH